jgi:hypothetical protein
MCKQEQGESIRSYVKRSFDTRVTIPNIADDDVIKYFQSSITIQSQYRDFGRNRPKTVVELRDMMQRWADEEEQECIRFPRRNNDNNGKRHNDRGGPSIQRDPMRKRKPDDTVGTMDRTPRGKKGEKPQDSTRSFITKGVQSTPRATTRCGTARSCANHSSRHLRTLLKKAEQG